MVSVPGPLLRPHSFYCMSASASASSAGEPCRLTPLSSQKCLARLNVPALARTAHEFLNGSPLCSSAEHFAGDRPQFEPLVSLSSSLQPRGACPQRTRCCRSCSEATRALLWHCSRCKATRCTRCLRTTALHQLLAEQRRQLLLLGTPINFSAPSAAEDALGAWPATD